MRLPCVLTLNILLVPAAALADDRPAAEKPFGLERRIPWKDSRVVGSPDPLSHYKVVRAFPKLTVKQPLCLTPEPGTDRLFILQHLNVWAGPGRIAKLPAACTRLGMTRPLLVTDEGLSMRPWFAARSSSSPPRSSSRGCAATRSPPTSRMDSPFTAPADTMA